MQIGLGFTALHAGLTTLPFALLSAAASGTSIRLAPRLGKRILSLGCVVLVAGMLGLWLTLRIAGTSVNSLDMVPALAVSGAGLGLIVAPLINIILAGISGGAAGSASGVLTTVQQIGGALGVAVIGIIFFGEVSGQAPVVAHSSAAVLHARLVSEGVPAPVADSVTQQYSRCFGAQAASSDPSATPRGCPAPSRATACPPKPAAGPAGPVRCAVSSAASTALAQDFDNAFRDGLFFDVAAFTLVFLLVFLLPRPQHMGRQAAAGGGH